MLPVDRVTLEQAAAILGCSISSARRYVLAGRLASHGGRYEHRMLSRADVEALALELYDWHRHLDDESSYWLTGTRATAVLGVSRQRLDQLANADRVPYVLHRDGTRLLPAGRCSANTLLTQAVDDRGRQQSTGSRSGRSGEVWWTTTHNYGRPISA